MKEDAHHALLEELLLVVRPRDPPTAREFVLALLRMRHAEPEVVCRHSQRLLPRRVESDVAREGLITVCDFIFGKNFAKFFEKKITCSIAPV